MIKTDNLCIGYTSIIVENIQIDLSKGEILTIIGPNGSGKSTLLKSLARQIDTLSGTIKLNNTTYSSISSLDFAKNVSYLSTYKMCKEFMTVFNVLESARYPYTGKLGILSDLDKEIIVSVIKRLNLEDLQSKYFNNLSDGQKQRVLIGRSLVQQPSLLILDEPTAFLDIGYKAELMNLIYSLAKKDNITIIQSLHDIELVNTFSDKLIALKDNKVAAYGNPSTILTQEFVNSLFNIKQGLYDLSTNSYLLEEF